MAFWKWPQKEAAVLLPLGPQTQSTKAQTRDHGRRQETPKAPTAKGEPTTETVTPESLVRHIWLSDFKFK